MSGRTIYFTPDGIYIKEEKMAPPFRGRGEGRGQLLDAQGVRGLAGAPEPAYAQQAEMGVNSTQERPNVIQLVGVIEQETVEAWQLASRLMSAVGEGEPQTPLSGSGPKDDTRSIPEKLESIAQGLREIVTRLQRVNARMG